MSKRGTASTLEIDQFVELASAVIHNLPRNLDVKRVQHLIEHQEELRDLLHQAFTPGEVEDSISPSFSYDKRKDGWELVEDVGLEPTIAPNKLQLVSFLKEGESSIGFKELIRRAREELHANLGQSHAEYLLEHQKEIPKDFRKHYLVFSGTIWCGRDGVRYVPYLYWYGRHWNLLFRWLYYDFDGYSRLLRSCE